MGERWWGSVAIVLAAVFLHAGMKAGAAPKGQVSNSQRPPFEAVGGTLRGMVVVLDPAGGGEGMSGASLASASASQFNLLVATHLSHALRQAGASVYLTRMDDRATSVGESDRAEREAIVRRAAPHLVLTIDCAHSRTKPFRAVTASVAGADDVLSDTLSAHIAAELVSRLKGMVASARTGAVDVLAPNEAPYSGAAWVRVCPGNFADAEFESWVAGARLETLSRPIYEAIVAAWKRDAHNLRARRGEVFGVKTEETVAQSPTARPPDGATTDIMKLARTVWPFERPLTQSNELAFVLDNYRRRALSDWTIFYFEPVIEEAEAGLKLLVRTNVEEIGKTAVGVARALGAKLAEVRVEVLPAERLGDQRFGVTRVPMAFVWGRPRELEDVQTQLLLGDWVWLLDETPDGNFLLVQGSDGYLGWVRADAIERLNGEHFAAWVNAPAATFVREHVIGSLRVSPAVRLPLARLPQRNANHVAVRLPAPLPATNGCTELEVPSAYVRLAASTDGWNQDPRTPELIEIAKSLLGRPYVFGGRSSLGTDCSGLVGDVYAAIGLTLPRDARQQVLVGKLVATRWFREALRPGDVLFFIDSTGRVIHTGLALGGSRFIHQSPPEVQVTSFDPSDPLYSATWDRAFVFARRPLD